MWETICEKLLEAVVRESGTPVLTVQCTSAFCFDVWLALVQDEHTGTWLLYHSTIGRRRLNRLEFCADMRAKRETGNAPDSGAYYRNLDYALLLRSQRFAPEDLAQVRAALEALGDCRFRSTVRGCDGMIVHFQSALGPAVDCTFWAHPPAQYPQLAHVLRILAGYLCRQDANTLLGM